MKKTILVLCLFLFTVFILPVSVRAQSTPSPIATSSAVPTLVPVEEPRVDITQKNVISEPLTNALQNQVINSTWPFNPVKSAIKNATNFGVPANTIVLLLLLPVIATFIAATRQILGIRGFGIFLPAALSISFVAIGPLVGIFLFIVIVAISTIVRFITRKLKLKLQYLPRMAMILWFVSFGVMSILFIAPNLGFNDLLNLSIFPVLILTLLTEDFTRIQLGKSFKTAIRLTTQTLVLALLSYAFLTYKSFQVFVLLNPEATLLVTFIINLILGRYVGLRLSEYLRFRKLINSK